MRNLYNIEDKGDYMVYTFGGVYQRSIFLHYGE